MHEETDEDTITIPVIRRCPECHGSRIIEDEQPCAECEEQGGGTREAQISLDQLAEKLYWRFVAIDKRERRRELEKLLAEMGGCPDA
jgi:hypothetical protein